MTVIDLSKLPRPAVPGLVRTLDEVHAELLAWLLAEYDWVVTPSPADPAWRLTRLIAARETLLRQAVADALAQASLAFATGANLDNIGATYYAIDRLAGEDDQAYRERLAAAPERYAVGLSGPWYEQTARGVDGVADARATSPAAGTVRIYIQADDGLLDDAGMTLYADGIPDAALLAAVTAVVTADEARQQTDTVEVSACTRQLYDVTVALTLFAGPDPAAVRTAAEDSLRELAASRARLGLGLSKPLIAGAAVAPPSVQSAEVTLQTIDGGGAATEVDAIEGADGVAPLARTLTVTVS